MNDEPENNRRNSSFAEEFYAAGAGLNDDFERPLINHSEHRPQFLEEQHVAAGAGAANQNTFQQAYQPPIPNAFQNHPQNSNQLARNNRNYDKLRGGNVLQGNNTNLNNNTSYNNISRDNIHNPQNVSSQANYNFNVSDTSMSNYQLGQAGAQPYYGGPNGGPGLYGQQQRADQFFDPASAPVGQQNLNIRQVQQEQNLNRLKQEQVNDGCCSFVIVLIVLLFGVGAHDCPYAPYKMWIEVEAAYYAFNVVFVYAYYKMLVARRREDYRFLLANCALNVIHSGWLIYGNVLYFQNNSKCQSDTETSTSLHWTMLALVIFGYVTLIKCCTFSSLVICFGPYIYRSLRRGRRPDANWVPTSRDILNNVMRGKYKAAQNEEGSECVICMVEYEEDDETIVLPCDGRHFFHAKCIENWLKQNNSCPMCKKPVTMADIKNQKKQKKSQRAQRG